MNWQRLRRLVILVAGLVGAGGAVLGVPSTSAVAGVWMRALCQNPNGSPAGIGGLVFGSQNPGVNAGADGGSYCPGGLTGTEPIVPVFGAGGGVWARIDEDSGSATQATWAYTASAGSTIAGGSITGVGIVQVTFGVPMNDYDAFISSPADQPDAADLVADCASPSTYTGGGLPGSNPCAENPIEQRASGISPDGLGPGGGPPPAPLVATIDHPGATTLFMTAACSTGQTDPCFYNLANEFYLSMDAGFSWADILLSDNNQPTATGFGGSLLAPGVVRGTAHLTFTASDPDGPGIYNVTVKLDGNPIYSGMPGSNGGECSPAGTDSSSGALIFDYQQPCPTSEQLDIPVDTTKLTDGAHDLQVIVEDAAENAATVLDQNLTTQNLATVASAAPERPETASTTGSGGSPTTASPAAPAAVYAFRLDKTAAKLMDGTVRRRYLDSRVVLSGAVVSQAGVPAPGVAVDAQVMTLAGQRFRTVASATTDAAGRFTLIVPRGDSRTVRLVVSGESARFKQDVQPDVTLAVHALDHERLSFTGHVAIDRGAAPAPIVVLADHLSSGWQTIASVQTSRTGRYSYTLDASPRALGQTFYFRASTPATALWQTSDSSVELVKVVR
jgi:hypothetical protein